MFFRRLKWNIIAQRNYWFALSAVIIIAGAIALIAHHGLPLGLSFTGGTTIDVKFNQTVSEAAVRTDPLSCRSRFSYRAKNQERSVARRASGASATA